MLAAEEARVEAIKEIEDSDKILAGITGGEGA